MKKRIDQLKIIFNDVLYVSKQTGTTNKKLTIFLAILTSNLTVFLDIVIILTFTLFLTGEYETFQTIEFVVEFINTNIYILPVVIVIRFSSKLYQTYLLKTLEVTVERNLRVLVMSQIFKEKDFSTADAYFYINQITAHVAFFYSSLTNFLNFLIQASVYFAYLFLTDPSIIGAFFVVVLLLIFPIRRCNLFPRTS